MRVIGICFLSLLAGTVALPLSAQPAFVRTIGSGAQAAPSVTIPVTVAVPRSNTVFVFFSCFPTPSTSTVTDSRSNTYTHEFSFSNNGLTTGVYRGYVAVPLLPGDQITVTAVAFATSASAYEFSGVLNLGTQAGGSTGGTTGNGFATTSVTTTQANNLLLGYVFRARNGGTPSTVTLDTFTPLLDFNGLVTAFRIVPPPGTYNLSGTLDPAPDGNYTFVTAQFGAFRSFRYGELNGDGNIDVLDVVVMASAIVGNVQPGTPPFSSPFAAGDVNRDGVIDLFDLIILNGFIVGNIASLPV